MTITKDMPIDEVVRKYPATIEVFLRHGLVCFGCAIARFESLGQGALGHGIEVEALLQDLNAVVPQQS